MTLSEKIEYFKKRGFNNVKVGEILEVSEKTVRYHMIKKKYPFYQRLRGFGIPQEPENLQEIKNMLLEGRCYLTGDKIDILDNSSYEFDHIIPKSKGGTGSISNLGLCTRNANQSKSDMELREYIDLCEKVVKTHRGK